ncbi:MAG TPA: Hsp20/alpha crystallin family protein [Opitutaceae bacterium]|nr:Hsp20/alpha crystallin family protein [Opitutaceae bacterium]
MRLVRYNHPLSRFYTPSPAFQTPWSGLENEISRLFDSVVGDFNTASVTNRFPVDLYEDQENYFVRAELPGVDRADINVEVVEDFLNITASRKTKDGDQEQSYSLSRSVNVADNVQADKVSAQYENGVLTVTLPKKEEAKPRKIAVSVN